MSGTTTLGDAEGTVLLVAGAVALVAVLYVMKKGTSTVAGQLGAGAVNAAGSAASGAVGAVGASVGLPTPDQTTTDAGVARWLIDNFGYLEATKWSGVPALFDALMMNTGTGTPPAAGSAVALAHPTSVDGLPFDYGTSGGW